MSRSNKGRLTSDSNEWATPSDVFGPLSEEFDFVLDCAAAGWNHKAGAYYTKEDDALTRDWYADARALSLGDGLDEDETGGYRGTVARTYAPGSPAAWLNPPYGRKKDAEGKSTGPALLDPFIRKAYQESRKGLIVVVLCFVRSDTALWEEVIMKAAEVRFIRSRVRFTRADGAKGPAPASSCLVIFKPGEKGPPVFTVWHREGCTCSQCKRKAENERTIAKPFRPRDTEQVLWGSVSTFGRVPSP